MNGKLLAIFAFAPLCLLALTWHDAAKEPFVLYGKIPEAPGYQRIVPDERLNQTQLDMGRCSAGIHIRFRTNSTEIHVKTDLESPSYMYHMPATGQSGMDLYCGLPGNETYCRTTAFNPTKAGYETVVYRTDSHEMADYALYLPLYNSVRQLYIGLDDDATLESAAPLSRESIVFYGTSITQGGCAARPALCHTNLISRILAREVFNFGFSGSGTLDEAHCDALLCVPTPALFVIECENNCSSATLRERLAPFIRRLRNAHPDAPVLVIGALPGWAGGNSITAALQQGIVDECGEGVHFLSGLDLLPGDPGEYTVDGLQLNSYGFEAFAKAILPNLLKLLQNHLPPRSE